MKSFILVCKKQTTGILGNSDYNVINGPFDLNCCKILNEDIDEINPRLNKNQSYYCIKESDTTKIFTDSYYYRINNNNIYDLFYTDQELRKTKLKKINSYVPKIIKLK